MLAMITYKVADNRTSLGRFGQWTPPVGLTFQGHWNAVDGMHGFAIVEATNEAMLEATSAYADTMDFTIFPIVEISAAVPIQLKAIAWADETDDVLFGDDEDDD